jgi:hypothetical protein
MAVSEAVSPPARRTAVDQRTWRVRCRSSRTGGSLPVCTPAPQEPAETNHSTSPTRPVAHARRPRRRRRSLQRRAAVALCRGPARRSVQRVHHGAARVGRLPRDAPRGPRRDERQVQPCGVSGSAASALVQPRRARRRGRRRRGRPPRGARRRRRDRLGRVHRVPGHVDDRGMGRQRAAQPLEAEPCRRGRRRRAAGAALAVWGPGAGWVTRNGSLGGPRPLRATRGCCQRWGAKRRSRPAPAPSP